MHEWHYLINDTFLISMGLKYTQYHNDNKEDYDGTWPESNWKNI